MTALKHLLKEADAAVRYNLSVGLAGCETSFFTDSRWAADSMRTIFGPHCEVSEVQPTEPSLRTERPSLWRVISAMLPEYQSYLSSLPETFARAQLYADVVGQRAVTEEGWTLVVHKGPSFGLTVFCPEMRLTYLLRPDNRIDVTHTEHLIKYPLKIALRMRGDGVIHSSACDYFGTGIVMIGSKGSGKSTLLMHLLAAGANYLGNDTVYVRSKSSPPMAMLTWPHILRLAPGTIDDNPVLKRFFRNGDASAAIPADDLRPAIAKDGKTEFYSHILHSIFNREPVITTARADVMLLLKFRLDIKRCRLHRLDPEFAKEHMLGRLMSDRPGGDWLPFYSLKELDSTDRVNYELMAQKLPDVYEFEFGPANTEPAESLIHALDLR